MLVGALAGGLIGYALYRAIRDRSERRLPVQDRTRQFRQQMLVREAAIFDVIVTGVAAPLFVDGLFFLSTATALGLVVFFLSSRCPACRRFLGRRAIAARRCVRCDASFND